MRKLKGSLHAHGRLIHKGVTAIRKNGPISAIYDLLWKVASNRFEHLRIKHAADLLQKPLVVTLCGANFELHPSRNGLSEELLLFGVHEPFATSLYTSVLRPGDNIIDIGSNLGYYLFHASRIVGPSGKLIGFEPAPDVFNILERNVKRNKLSNVEVFPWACGAKTGMADFYCSEIPNWGSLLHEDKLLQTANIKVEVKAVDNLLEQLVEFQPNVIRMDVEGGELMVIEGAIKVIAREKPVLFIEFHPFATGIASTLSAIRSFKEMGYRNGVLIERTWDWPWISGWLRKRKALRADLGKLLEVIGNTEVPIGVFSLILTDREPVQ